MRVEIRLLGLGLCIGLLGGCAAPSSIPAGKVSSAESPSKLTEPPAEITTRKEALPITIVTEEPAPTAQSLTDDEVVEQSEETAPSNQSQQTTSKTSDATAMLGQIAIKGRAPKTGYDRSLFGNGWGDPDHNGCDARNDMLARDLTVHTYKTGTANCVVLTATLEDPYTGALIEFQRGQRTSNAVQIDHVVALSDAWQKGAQKLSSQSRYEFANDPLNLLAVDGPTNASKGDRDAASWLPPNRGFWCEYVTRQVEVKYKYDLWMTKAEHNASARVLQSHCN